MSHSKERVKDHSGQALIFISACISLIAGLLVTGPASGQGPERKDGPPPALVEVAPVIEKEVTTRITLLGTGEPWLETVVASEEAGVVNKMNVEEGDRVKKGQVLCEQDTTQLKLELEESQYAISEAKILRNKAKREFERQQRLYKIDSVSEKAYEDAKFNYDASRKKVNQLRADRKNLEDQLRKKQVKAPVSGYVVKRQCQIGQWLGEGDPAVTLVVPDPILFMVQVPERYVPSIKAGNTVEVTFDALQGKEFQGEIDAVVPKADTAARTFPVRIRIPNPESEIKPGMLGRATLPVGDRRKALLVPKDALVFSGNGKVVFIVIDQTARLVPVETGDAHGPLIEVKGDLKPDLKVVIRGNERLRPGQPVKVIQESPQPKASSRSPLFNRSFSAFSSEHEAG
jgi:RND family efflux transporter MFP subunit